MSLAELQSDPFISAFQQSLNNDKAKWDDIITVLSKKLKELKELPDLQSTVFAYKQDAVDFHTTLMNSIAQRTAVYKMNYAECYNKYKNTPEHVMRVKTETSISRMVEGELAKEKCLIDMTDSHAKFLDSVISNLDGIIYAIKNRIKIEEILNSYTA